MGIDQREVTRPSGSCDIGAFEYDPVPQVVLSSSIPADGAVLAAGSSSIQVVFNKDVLHDGSGSDFWPYSALNPDNYLLVDAGTDGSFQTESCAGGLLAGDTEITVNSVSYVSPTATLAVNNGVALPIGLYKLFVCGTTSITDLYNLKLNYGLSDASITFRVGTAAGAAGVLPTTGFARGKVTSLPAQTTAYAALGDLWLEIPKLGVQMPIVGVPQADGKWDVSWLGSNAGWLNGSAFPTWAGNSVLTGHVWNADNTVGPFGLHQHPVVGGSGDRARLGGAVCL